MPYPICRITWCQDMATMKSYCARHYVARKEFSDVPINDAQCSIDWCSEPVDKRGPGIYCTAHLAARVKDLAPYNGPPKPPPPVRERKPKTNRGYRMIRRDGRTVGEHRAVMEDHIGRPLVSGENIHHINGVRNDNRIENLELWNTSQPGGQRVPDKVEWATEILRRYAPERLT